MPECERPRGVVAGQLVRAQGDRVFAGRQVDGCNRPATVVDHIVPLAEGGEMWDRDNWQAMCAEHHQVKSTRDALRGKQRPR